MLAFSERTLLRRLALRNGSRSRPCLQCLQHSGISRLVECSQQQALLRQWSARSQQPAALLHTQRLFSTPSSKDDDDEHADKSSSAAPKRTGIRGKVDSMKKRYDEEKEDLKEDFAEYKGKMGTKLESTKASVKERTVQGKATLKEMWRRYGLVAVGTYFGIYFSTLGGLYFVFEYGFMTASDVPAGGEHAIATLKSLIERLPDWLEKYVNTLYVKMQEEPRFRNFALAWITTKVTEPVRLFLTAVVTPRVARLVGRAPKLPPKPPKDPGDKI
jgi:Protein of unknown function (DUF1279)